MSVNLGTRGPEEARELVEYAPWLMERSPRCDARAEIPIDLRDLGVGNEMDGPWQIGHKTADEYGRVGKRSREVDEMDGLNYRTGGVRELEHSHGDLPLLERAVLDHVCC